MSAEQKKVLFSLNIFLQEDKNKNLVVDFIQVGGLAQRAILGKEDKVQLQNLLYVDGMQDVLQHIQVINWYRWIT